ncbi:C-type lectin domain family 12 member A-like [Dipodomys spectabilis]|uniref:C-type lectin domain family 12 member A-like n=1 Tax=Dipodomys spectabilis TaxID=105255 RepID=UPI001C54BF48|nr:C-type lectin domain family 12 member A-like [Dipodomys spectabilis]
MGSKAPSHGWVKTAFRLTLVLLLLLLIGLKVFWILIYKQQNVQEELQRNVSLQQMGNVNSPEKIQNLNEKIQNLNEKIQNLNEKIQNLNEKIQNQSITMQTLATRLCQELQEKEPEHTCNPCAQNWIWHADACYLLHRVPDTWQNSVKSCADRNASVLSINKNSVEFIQSMETDSYWLEASPRQNGKYSMTVNQTVNSSLWAQNNLNGLNTMHCGYLEGQYIYFNSCTGKRFVICEKTAGPVRVESVLCSRSRWQPATDALPS